MGGLLGLAPALQVARTNLAALIREGGRGAPGGRGNRLRSGLVVGQTALAVVLLVGAGLLLGSFARMVQVDPGFHRDGVLTFPLSLPQARYPEDAQVRDFYGRFLERLETVPGVRSADAVVPGLAGGQRFSNTFTVAGREPLPPGESQSLQTRMATAGYFSTAGIPVRRGRAFTEWDREDAPAVLVINEAAVRRFFPDEDPLGQRITLGWTRDGAPVGGEVVGVVGDVRHFGLTSEPVPEVYIPHAQVPNAGMTVVLRTEGDPRAVAGPVRAALRELDPSLAAGTFEPLDDLLSSSVAQPRFYALLLGLFAAVALTLAAVGILGVMSYLVAQRTREIGIRMALGADARAVHRLVVGRGMLLTIAGFALGIPATLALTRVPGRRRNETVRWQRDLEPLPKRGLPAPEPEAGAAERRVGARQGVGATPARWPDPSRSTFTRRTAASHIAMSRQRRPASGAARRPPGLPASARRRRPSKCTWNPISPRY
jgi:putative ABC transport system permease protein